MELVDLDIELSDLVHLYFHRRSVAGQNMPSHEGVHSLRLSLQFTKLLERKDIDLEDRFDAIAELHQPDNGHASHDQERQTDYAGAEQQLGFRLEIIQLVHHAPPRLRLFW